MSLTTLINKCLGTRDAMPLARQHAERWASWLTPIHADAPVGEDPGYDDDFQRMREEVNKLSGADADLQGPTCGHVLPLGALAKGR